MENLIIYIREVKVEMLMLLFFIDERNEKMADKRMFSLKIVDSDLFLEMPLAY